MRTTDVQDDLRQYEAMALMVGRSLARRLRGLRGPQLQQVTRRFLGAFLGELVRDNEMDSATLLGLAHLPLDLALMQHQGADPGPLEELATPKVAADARPR